MIKTSLGDGNKSMVEREFTVDLLHKKTMIRFRTRLLIAKLKWILMLPIAIRILKMREQVDFSTAMPNKTQETMVL